MLREYIQGALRFQSATYEEVEHDESFTTTAWILVALSSFLAMLGVNAGVAAESLGNWLLSAVLMSVFMLAGFAVAAAIVTGVGRVAFKAEVTYVELVRTLGLASIWLSVGFLGILVLIVPVLICLIGPALIVGTSAAIVSWLIAAHRALDTTWVQTIFTILLAWLVWLLLWSLASWITGALGWGGWVNSIPLV
jgi:hypothetical protein